MPNTMIKIGSYAATGSVSTIDFTSIPQTYTDLYLYVSSRVSWAGSWYDYEVQFNGSTTGYGDKMAYGYGTTVSSLSETGTGIVVRTSSTANTANTFGNESIYIPGYSTSNYKPVSVDAVTENNGTSLVGITNGIWSNNNPITQITLNPVGAETFAAGTTATLYGIKNS